MPASKQTEEDTARAVCRQAATSTVTLRSRFDWLACWISCGPSGPPLFAEANGLRGLFGSKAEPRFGLFRRLLGTAHARIQPITRSIARPGGCWCDV
jgi:hypothetical protein